MTTYDISKPILEEYRPVTGFPAYRISTLGRIQSRYVRSRGRGGRTCGYVMSDEWHDMKGSVNGKGYRRVTLRKDGVPHPRHVHRLVLEAWVGPCPEGMEACHWDGNPGNNCVNNLRWDTRRGNYADSVRHGTAPRGEKQGQSRLTDDDIRAIRRLHAEGALLRSLAGQFNISEDRIGLIVNGKAWTHIPWAPAVRHVRPRPRPRPCRGERNGNSKLCEDDVRAIRHLRVEGLIVREIAARFGVSAPTIRAVITGATWKHIATTPF